MGGFSTCKPPRSASTLRAHDLFGPLFAVMEERNAKNRSVFAERPRDVRLLSPQNPSESLYGNRSRVGRVWECDVAIGTRSLAEIIAALNSEVMCRPEVAGGCYRRLNSTLNSLQVLQLSLEMMMKQSRSGQVGRVLFNGKLHRFRYTFMKSMCMIYIYIFTWIETLTFPFVIKL